MIFASFLFTDVQAVRIGIMSDLTFCGEREVGWRIKRAAENLGWEAVLDEKRGRLIRRRRDLDWVICLLWENHFRNPYCENYVTIFHPGRFVDHVGQLLPFYEWYDGYLLTIEPTESFGRSFEARKEKFFSIPFYPTVQTVPYQRCPLNNLMTMIPVWGRRKSDLKYQTLYKLLSQGGFTKFYGVNRNEELLEQGYMGRIPFDGASVIDVLQQHGITLLIHSNVHNHNQIPSSRIFEAAGASTVIISDGNAFVKKHFGDSIFYIDISQSAEEIYGQIQVHMDTIRLDPQRALDMAQKAHEIFENHFSMEAQLLQIEAMHQQVKAFQKRK